MIGFVLGAATPRLAYGPLEVLHLIQGRIACLPFACESGTGKVLMGRHLPQLVLHTLSQRERKHNKSRHVKFVNEGGIPVCIVGTLALVPA